MDFFRNHRLLVSVTIIAALLIGIVTWQFLRSQQQTPGPEDTNTPTVVVNDQTPQGGSAVVSPLPEGQVSALRLARLFAERFGTFSSQGQYEGIREVLSVATPSLQEWMTGSYIPELQRSYPATTYAAQTTTVLGTTLRESTDTGAVVLVRAQRVMAVDGQEAAVTNATLEVTLVKNDSGWLVDRVVWQQSVQ